MLKVGHGKPGIVRHEGDSHHPNQVPFFEANGWFYISLDRWMEVQEFQSYKWPEGIELPFNVNSKEIGPAWAAAQTMKRLVKMADGQRLWQMNVAHPNLKDYYRITVTLGGDNYVRWSWVDIYLREPYYKIKARIFNKSMRGSK